jgi:flagellar biosynthetic protein FlhB
MADFLVLFHDSLRMTGAIALPMMIVLGVVGVFANYVQVGWLFTWYPVIPRLDKINPITGFSRLFSVRSVVETIKNLAKLAVIAFVAFQVIRGHFLESLQLGGTTVAGLWLFVARMCFDLLLQTSLVLIVLAILDWAYQKYEYERGLKMTKEEVKEERKQMEGDPQIKGRIKQVMREAFRRRMMGQVPKATVVVTNPTYIAIALLYEPDEMETPRVLAKGKRLVAERIREIARENGIPIVEDKPLARALYDRVQPGDDIPAEFFAAVAEVLAYVYRLRNRRAA